jgi:hypothetical protein
MKPSSSLLGAIVALALVSAIVFVGVALHEIAYASDHPYQYGPAHVIAWGAGAGALLGRRNARVRGRSGARPVAC